MSFPPPDPTARQFPQRRLPRRSLRGWWCAVAWCGLAAAAFSAGAIASATLRSGADHVPPSTIAAGDAQAGRDQMISLLAKRYFRDVDAVTLAALDVTRLPAQLDDPYTRFLTKSQYDQFMADERADGAGVGIDVVKRAGGLEVVRVFPGSPASVAGLQRGDLLIAVDGHSLGDRSLSEGLALVKGDDDSTAHFRINRGSNDLASKNQDVQVVRRRTGEWMVAAELRRVADRTVGYVALLDFSEGAGRAARDAVERLLAAGASTLVLDLRGNPGGWAGEAVRVAEIFLPEGSPVLIERGAHVETRVYSTHEAPVDATVPVRVLVDRNTASSAEIVAGALHDNGRAALVGETTFGKGRIQDVIPLDTGGAMKLTFAEYLTPSGFALDRVGIAPDAAATTEPFCGLDLAFFVAVTQSGARP